MTSSNTLTVLEGNEIVNLGEILYDKDNKKTTYKKGTTFTIEDVIVNPKAHSGFSFSVKEIEGLNFDPAIVLFEDKFPINEETVINWVDDTGHPEGI